MSAADPVQEWGPEFGDVIAVVQSRAISIEDAWAVLAAARPAIEREAKVEVLESFREWLDEECPHEPDSHAEGCCEVCDWTFAAMSEIDDRIEAGDE